VVFSVVRLVAYDRGKRASRPRMRRLGLALRLCRYVVWQTWLLYVVGAGLSVVAWLDRA
jgi:hypothetical protein